MTRRTRTPDMRDRVEVYKQIDYEDENGNLQTVWLYDYSLWCRQYPVFREQLEQSNSGSKTLRNRLDFETRFPCRLTTMNRVRFNGKFYRVTIAGDADGQHDRFRFYGESLEDGGS